MKCTLAAMLVLGFAAVWPAEAASVIIEYDLGGIDQNDIDEASVLFAAENVSATPLTATPGLDLLSDWGEVYPGAFTAQGWPSDFDFTTDTGQYYTFSVTNNTNDVLELTGLTLALLRGNFGGSSGAENWALRSSQDNFASNIITYDIADSNYDEQITFDGTASGGRFASALNLNSGASIEFRLGGYYPSGESRDYSGLANMTPGTYDGDVISGAGSNVILYGTTSNPVPEPMTVTLLALGGLLIRRKK